MLKPSYRAMAVVAGLLGACGATGTASADGYASRAMPPPAFSWTGFYVGVNGGYGWSDDQTVRINETFTPLGGVPAAFFSGDFGSLSPAGGFGGVQVGANLQLGGIVLGVEADGQWADITDDSLLTRPALGGLVYTIGTSNKVSKFGTVRGRLGVAMDRTLLYATGGLAWGSIKHTMAFADNLGFTAFDQTSGTHVGYVVGAGLEQAFTPSISLKVEYQFIDLGSENYLAVESIGGVASGFRINTDTDTNFHTVRVGLNFKLGPGASGPMK